MILASIKLESKYSHFIDASIVNEDLKTSVTQLLAISMVGLARSLLTDGLTDGGTPLKRIQTDVFGYGMKISSRSHLVR